MIHTFTYVGNKFKYMNDIYKHIFKILDGYKNIDTFIDVFGGSGTVAINTEKHFSKTILNEYDKNIFNIHNTFKYGTYEHYKHFVSIHNLNATDLSKYDMYYNFRNKCNELYFQKDDMNFGYFSYFIIGACINSISRFGPNGFNQSYGCRDLSKRLNMISYNQLHKIYSNIELMNQSYELILEAYNNPNTLLFLDPPYSNMSDTYASNFDVFDKKIFLDIITNHKSKIIYTDSYDINEWGILKANGWKRNYIRKISGIKASKHNESVKENRKIEVLYTNF